MNNRFMFTPQVKFNRSKFDLSHGIKTTLSVGKLVPVDCTEVLPGDTFSTEFNAVARISSAFLRPVLDNAWLDIYHFFVPLRLTYEKAQDVFGVANPSSYTQDNLEDMPVTTHAETVASGSVADYLGLPVGKLPKGISLAPFRAFARIYNEWFRNENTCDEVFVQKGDTVSYEHFNSSDWSANNYTGMCPNVGKKKDYFTSCLPKPQKGTPVNAPLAGRAPIGFDQDAYFADGKPIQSTASKAFTWLADANEIANQKAVYVGLKPNGTIMPALTDTANISNNDDALLPSSIDEDGGIVPNGRYLYADLANANSMNINDLRFAFQLQKMLERDALYGSRYNEYLLGHFGVVNPDSRLQFTEYLGGARIPINKQQVAQTSEGTESSPLAQVGAFSVSGGKSRYSKGFTEHGYVITVACVRTLHTYSQGISKMWTRKSRNDFYDPLFANLGEQPVYKSELFIDSANVTDDTVLRSDVFGYNEAFAEYRYAPSRITGQMRSGLANSLDIWHFGDTYSNAPTLSEAFTDETATFFDRTVAVPSSSQDSFILDGWFNTKAIRVMPLYSVPGLIDHH